MMDLKRLHSKLVAEMGELLFFLEGKGCELCLVGGVTRDFFLTGELVQDVDIEVRSQKHIDELLSDFPDKLSFEKLAYGIVKVSWNTFSLEFSPPRAETYIEGDFTHKNFTATIDHHLTHTESFKRRDFTINAIGLKFTREKLELVDPYNGLSAIEKKELIPVSENFVRDPVRFLRLIRFSIKLGFKIGAEAEKMLQQFNLQNLSTYYFKTEWKKAQDANEFLRKFHHYTMKNKISAPEWCVHFQPLGIETKLLSPQDYLVNLLFQGKTLEIDNPQDLFELGKNDLNSLKSLISCLKNLDWHKIDQLKKQAFDKVKADSEFLKLHEALNLDRQSQFSGNDLLKTLPPQVTENYFKLVSKVSQPLSNDMNISNNEKALYKSYMKITELC